MRKPKPGPVRQRQLLFPVAAHEMWLCMEARQRCRQLLVLLLRRVLQMERTPRRESDD